MWLTESDKISGHPNTDLADSMGKMEDSKFPIESEGATMMTSLTVPVPVPVEEEKHSGLHLTSSAWELAAVDTIKDPKRKELRIRLEGMLSGSTISGISQAFSDRKGKYKIFWIILFLLGCVAFGIIFYFICKHFLAFPMLTQIRKNSEPFKWPHLTFCNPTNPIPFWKSDELIEIWNETVEEAHNYKLPKYGGIGKTKIWEHYIALASISPATFYRFNPWDLIYIVQVVYKEATVASTSNSLNRFRTVTHLPGIFHSHLDSFRAPMSCVTLKPENILKELKLNENLSVIKVYLLMDFRSHKIYNNGFESRKLYFYINNINQTLQASFPHFVMAGTTSVFTLKQKTHERVTDCTSDTFPIEMYDSQMKSVHMYSGGYEDCRTFISQKLFVEKCGCFNGNLPLYRFSSQLPKLCTNMSVYSESEMVSNINCMNRILEKDSRSQDFRNRLTKECSKFSQSPCESLTYALSRHSIYWQDDMNDMRSKLMTLASKMLPNGKQNGTDEYPAEEVNKMFARKNMAIINVMASKEGTVATFDEFEYPLSHFLSDFGGAIGLWIGLSVISFFEISELILVFIKYLRSG